MKNSILLATQRGFLTLAHDKDVWHETARGLGGKNVTTLIAREGVILAGTTNGIFRSDDLGKTWREASYGLTTRHLRWMALHHNISDLEFAGTEPANIFISRDGAKSWRECTEIASLRDQHRWMLPYSPEAGCVRGFTFHGKRAYAAVEVGGALVSDDSGESWRLADGSDGNPSFGNPPKSFIHPDVHSISVHPSSRDLVFAPTGGGFYRSNDGGKIWELLYDCYCRAVWLDPRDAKHLILGPASGVDSNGRIEESSDGGKTWQNASGGLKVPWRKHMVERFAEIGDELFAVLSNGGLIAARLGVAALDWREILPSDAGVNAVTAMQK